jgi:hypothetical protein
MAPRKDTKKETVKKTAPVKKGRPRNLKSPEHLYEIFTKYKKYVKDNPYLVEDWVGKDATPVIRKKERPLTMEGFKIFVADSVDIDFLNVKNYIENHENRYPEFEGVVTRIKQEIRDEQIGGGMAGMYNQNLTARINGLAEKTQTELSGTLNVPKLPDIGSR